MQITVLTDTPRKRARSAHWILSSFLLFALCFNLPPVLGDVAPDSSMAETAENGPLKPAVLDRNIAKVVLNLIQKQHYNKLMVDDQLSEKLFQEYFRRLDPGKIYFLQSDVDEFVANRFILDDMLTIGDVKFAFDVYERFLQRIRERLEYVRKSVSSEFDFTVDESMIIDRKDMPWPANQAEMDEIWRQRIKNQLLIQQFLVDEKPGQFDEAKGSPQEQVVRKYEQFLNYFMENDHADIMETYLTTLLTIFDPHSNYLNWRSLEDFDIAMKLSLQGIGATLKHVDGYTEVVELVRGGPAERDGRLQPGDRIIAVAQGQAPFDEVVDMPLNKVVRKIRGAKGTQVRLSVIKSLHGAPIEIDLIRDEVQLKDQEAKGTVETPRGVDKTRGGYKLGVIDVPSFYADFDGLKAGDKDAKSTSHDVRRIVEEMQNGDGIDGVLIDLRSNGGGSLDEAINMTGLFIPAGPVVQVRNRDSVQVRRDTDDGFFFNLPLVVLVNRSSASASEIFAGAIKDYGRGIVVGDQTTHGKGTVQTVYKLDKVRVLSNQKCGAVKFTMAKFYRVTGGSTQKIGVAPDIIFPSFLDHMDIGEATLDFVMPWDEIEPQPASPTATVAECMPEIKRRVDDRLKANADFQQLVADIASFGVRKQQKTLSLNKEKRIALKKEDEYWAKRSSAVLGKRIKSEMLKEEAENAPESMVDTRDLYLEEAENILMDLVELARQQPVVQGGDVSDPATAVETK